MLLGGFAIVALLSSASVSGASGAPSTSPSTSSTPPSTSSLSKSDVTIYGATWCPACRALEAGLRSRQVPFEIVDVDKSPQAFERARAAAGSGGAIPLTGIVHGSDTAWVVGADIDGVERLYRGN